MATNSIATRISGLPETSGSALFYRFIDATHKQGGFKGNSTPC